MEPRPDTKEELISFTFDSSEESSKSDKMDYSSSSTLESLDQ